eukprot:gnl/Dysnectes_brevis/1155_a1289_1897.p1 GENE.gnl/Dysnectes_brevis/1155_a1289_1897~~gnl/Dysnectes_brevis/1155_a1289_1897.p1  ORF type:complete len:423 (+),score=130.32 gnl/Dysnectes_brevis/1155_a1289_1897:1214-2482(+)
MSLASLFHYPNLPLIDFFVLHEKTQHEKSHFLQMMTIAFKAMNSNLTDSGCDVSTRLTSVNKFLSHVISYRSFLSQLTDDEDRDGITNMPDGPPPEDLPHPVKLYSPLAPGFLTSPSSTLLLIATLQTQAALTLDLYLEVTRCLPEVELKSGTGPTIRRMIQMRDDINHAAASLHHCVELADALPAHSKYVVWLDPTVLRAVGDFYHGIAHIIESEVAICSIRRAKRKEQQLPSPSDVYRPAAYALRLLHGARDNLKSLRDEKRVEQHLRRFVRAQIEVSRARYHHWMGQHKLLQSQRERSLQRTDTALLFQHDSLEHLILAGDSEEIRSITRKISKPVDAWAGKWYTMELKTIVDAATDALEAQKDLPPHPGVLPDSGIDRKKEYFWEEAECVLEPALYAPYHPLWESMVDPKDHDGDDIW